MATFTLIESVTVGSGGAASIDFTSIPATYTDLVLKISARDTGDNQAKIQFNLGSPTGYTNRVLEGDGATTYSNSASGSASINGYTVNFGGRTANTFGNADIYIPSYAGSSNKSFSSDGVEENNATTAYAKMFAGLWSNTTAITSVKLIATTLFVEHSTAYLYGVSNA
jgi:hypothetical protein